jgi:tetratricopeptide (TPR) repeat protein
LLAKSSPGSTNQRALYRQSIEKFESAAKIETEAKTSRVYGLWGVALLELGKADNDRMLMREAAERLQTATQIEPNNGELRYNLACAFALLDQPEDGMRHLKICLDNDPDHTYFNAASKDPDFDNLRSTAEYYRIFPNESSVSPQEIIRSQISDQ